MSDVGNAYVWKIGRVGGGAWASLMGVVILEFVEDSSRVSIREFIFFDYRTRGFHYGRAFLWKITRRYSIAAF